MDVDSIPLSTLLSSTDIAQAGSVHIDVPHTAATKYALNGTFTVDKDRTHSHLQTAVFSDGPTYRPATSLPEAV